MSKENQPFPELKLSSKADKLIQKRIKAAYKERLAAEKVSAWGLGRRLAFSAMALFLVVVVGGGGFGYHVVHSDSIIPGDNFYGLKLKWEDSKLASLDSSVEKSRYYLKLSDKRLDEANESFMRETGEKWFTRTAYAVSGDENRLQASVTASLLSESSRYLSLSLEEAGVVKGPKDKLPLVAEIDASLKEYELIVNELTSEKFVADLVEDQSLKLVVEEVESVTEKNQQFIDDYEDLVESKYSRVDWEEVEDWDEIEDWDSLWDDFDDEEWEDEEDWDDWEDWGDEEEDFEWESDDFDWDDLGWEDEDEVDDPEEEESYEDYEEDAPVDFEEEDEGPIDEELDEEEWEEDEEFDEEIDEYLDDEFEDDEEEWEDDDEDLAEWDDPEVDLADAELEEWEEDWEDDEDEWFDDEEWEDEVWEDDEF
jgi:hypothetical protein